MNGYLPTVPREQYHKNICFARLYAPTSTTSVSCARMCFVVPAACLDALCTLDSRRLLAADIAPRLQADSQPGR